MVFSYNQCTQTHTAMETLQTAMETLIRKPLSDVMVKTIAVDIFLCAISGQTLDFYMKDKYQWSDEEFKDKIDEYKTTLLKP